MIDEAARTFAVDCASVSAFVSGMIAFV